MLSCFRMQMPAVWEHNHVRQFWVVIIPNHFDGRLWLNHFKMTKTTFSMMYNEISSLVSPVMLSHRAKSHEFF